MARIKLGALLAGLRGTIGGITFSANGSGLFAKAWARGPNPRTTPQNAQRNILTTFASGWRSLSGANQATWIAYAALPAQDLEDSLGETYSISGFNWFIRINTHLALAGRAQRDIAPVSVRPIAPTVLAFRLGITDDLISSALQVDNTDPDFGADLAIKSEFFLSIGRLASNTLRQFLIAAQPNPDGSIDLTSQVIAQYGNIPPESVIFYYTMYQDLEGQRGPFTVVRTESE